jgi:hypothetical protein
VRVSQPTISGWPALSWGSARTQFQTLSPRYSPRLLLTLETFENPHPGESGRAYALLPGLTA